MSVKRRTTFAALLLCLPLASQALTRSELAPPDAPISLSISNTSEFWSRLKQSSIGKLWADRQFQDFMGNFDNDDFLEMLFDGEPTAEDKIFVEQWKMMTGELVMAVSTEKDSQPYIIGAVSQEDYDRSLKLDDQMREVSEKPFIMKRDSFQDIPLIEYIHNPDTPNAYTLWQAFSNGTVLLGPSREWVERSLVQLKKEGLTEPTAKNPELTIRVPVASLIQQTLKQAKEKQKNKNTSEPDPELIFDALGLLGVETITAKAELKETEMVMDYQLKISDLKKGLFTIFDVAPAEMPKADFIPANVSSLEVGRFNLLRFWQEIPRVLGVAAPQAAPQFAMIIAMLEQNAGIRLEQDLLGNLGSKYLSFAVAGQEDQNTVLAIELVNTAAFKKALETLMSAPNLQAFINNAIEIEPFQNHTIYSLKSANEQGMSTFSVMDGYFVWGHPQGVRKMLRSRNDDGAVHEGFEQSKLVQGLRQHIPSSAFGFSATDWKRSMAELVHNLQKPQFVAALKRQLATFKLPDLEVDMEKLPPADHIASFFNMSYQYTEATPSGIHQKVILKY